MASLGSFLWIAGIGALFYYMMSKGGGCCGGGHNHGDHKQDDHKEHGSGDEQVSHHEQLEDKPPSQSEFSKLKDPVCGMEVKKNSTSLVSDHFGHTFHFCSEQCRKLFDINPNKYIGSL
jgi:YHS domain-containing protein